jgi:hypothetical protein
VTDVVLIAVIVAFFVAGAGVVRLLDGMIARSGTDADPGDEAELEPGGAELERGRDRR